MAINPNTIFSAVSVISDLLNSFTAVDIVGIYDATSLQQVFSTARPLKAEVRETSIVMKHPVETGSVIADNHIINPIEINMSLLVNQHDYNTAYGQMKQAFIAATSLFVQTRTSVYNNMIIADMPHTEDAEIYDGVIISLHLQEVLYVVPNSVSSATLPANFSPLNPVDSNTVAAGQKYPATLSSSNITAVQSLLTGIGFKALSGL